MHIKHIDNLFKKQPRFFISGICLAIARIKEFFPLLVQTRGML